MEVGCVLAEQGRAVSKSAGEARMSESELQDAVIELAQILGWKVAHFRPARTDKGWRTPVSGDGKGFPDLVMVRDGVLFVELKAERGKVSQDQAAWLHALRCAALGTAGVRVHVWKPAQWLDGTIAAALGVRL